MECRDTWPTDEYILNTFAWRNKKILYSQLNSVFLFISISAVPVMLSLIRKIYLCQRLIYASIFGNKHAHCAHCYTLCVHARWIKNHFFDDGRFYATFSQLSCDGRMSRIPDDTIMLWQLTLSNYDIIFNYPNFQISQRAHTHTHDSLGPCTFPCAFRHSRNGKLSRIINRQVNVLQPKEAFQSFQPLIIEELMLSSMQ